MKTIVVSLLLSVGVFASEAKDHNDFQEQDVRGKILSKDLQGANFQLANLQGVSLREANLYFANFKNANLQEVDLSGADLVQVDLRGAKMEGTNLSGAIVTEKLADYLKQKGYAVHGVIMKNNSSDQSINFDCSAYKKWL